MRYRAIINAVVVVLATFQATPSAAADVTTLGILTGVATAGQLRALTDRRTADNLLKRARQAMEDGNLKLAEWYVERAERLNVTYDSIFQRFVDTPAKVREELKRRRAANTISKTLAHQEATPNESSAKPSDQAVSQSASPPTDKDIPAAEALDPAIGTQQELKAVSTPEDLAQELTKGSMDSVDPAPLAGVGTDAPEILDPASVEQLGPQLPEVLLGESRSPTSAETEITSSRLIERGAMIHSAIGQAMGAAAPGASVDLQAQKAQALQWLAEARAALDRDDVKTAEQFARAAQELRVPDAAYKPGDPRPWMLLMEVAQRERRLDSVAAREVFAPPPQFGPSPQVVPIPSQVVPSVYDPQQDRSRVVTASGQVPQAPPVVSPPDPNDRSQMVHNPTVAGQSAPPHESRPAPRESGAVPREERPAAAASEPPLPSVVSPPPASARPGSLPPGPTTSSARPSSLPPAPTPSSAPASLPAPPRIAPELAGVDVPPLTVKMPGSAEKAAQPASKLRRTPDVAPAAAEGVRLFREGQQALKAHDLPKARQLMLAAWEHEAAIDPETRQMLQDNLQLLPRSAPNKNATKENKDQTDSNKQRPVPPGQAAVERLVADVTSQHAKVRTLRETDPTKAWTQLKELRARVAKTEIDEASKQQLIRRVDGYLNEMEDYVEKNRARIENDERNRQVLEEVERHREMRVRTQQQLAELVEEFNALMDQQRFPEAVVLAKKARELDPLNPVVQNLIWKSQFARQMMSSMMRQERFHTGALAALDAVDEAGVSMEDEWGVEFPKYWEELSNRRLKKLKENRRRFSDVEVDIQKSLKKPVEVHFESAPLSEVVNKLASMAGINVFLDPEGIAAEGVTTDTSVSIDLRKPVSLRSALNLILQPLHLSYIIQDEVLRITSEQVREGDVYSEVYHVADLVIPIPNFVPGNNIGLPAAIREAHRVLAQGYTGGLINTAPLAVMAENPGLGTGTSTASVLAQMGAVGIGPHATGTPQQFGFGPPDALGGGTQADFDTLIDLITTTIEPDSWEDVGGPGAIDGFPTNLSLVVSQTQDVHERIADLLEQLRRLQDLQVTIEVRFITLNDDFFERIGVDFDFNIDDNTGLNSADLVKLDDEGPDITIGLDPNGNPTFDLDIPFTQGSFASTTPTFGGFDANSAANIGFAILSDIEAFFLIQAAQGDTRTNVLQAPKVTLFNGQTAFVSDTAQRPFVTSVIPVVGDFAAAHQPVITVLNEGTSLSVRAVVSNDRRFIRLDLVPFFSKIGEVDTFTFTGRTDSDSGTVAVDPTDDTETVRENVIESMVGTTVQLPTFAFTTVSTTVNVPDGGTILLGGIKRLSEGRNERGVPVLSKVPYVNRLFRNVGIGRETSSLMMMVTPRIIIQEEEEEKLLERTP